MQEKTALVSFYQKVGEGNEEEVMHWRVEVPIIQLEKMAEIIKREPEVDWENRDWDLNKKACEELEAEGKSQRVQPEENA